MNTFQEGQIVSALLYPSRVVIGTVGRELEKHIEIVRADGSIAGYTPISMVRLASQDEQNEYYFHKQGITRLVCDNGMKE